MNETDVVIEDFTIRQEKERSLLHDMSITDEFKRCIASPDFLELTDSEPANVALTLLQRNGYMPIHADHYAGAGISAIVETYNSLNKKTISVRTHRNCFNYDAVYYNHNKVHTPLSSFLKTELKL